MKMIGELIGIGGMEVVGKVIGEWNRWPTGEEREKGRDREKEERLHCEDGWKKKGGTKGEENLKPILMATITLLHVTIFFSSLLFHFVNSFLLIFFFTRINNLNTI